MKIFYRLFITDTFGDDWSTNIDSENIDDLKDIVNNPLKREYRQRIIKEIGIGSTCKKWTVKKFELILD